MQSLPIIIYTGQGAHASGGDPAQTFAETIIVKDVKSPERLLDETALFLHRVEAQLARDKSAACSSSCTTPMRCSPSKHVLVVDDDVRNIFSLTSVLEDARHEGVVRRERQGRDRDARA